MAPQEPSQPGDEFRSDYLSTVVRYAHEMAQQENIQLSILDLCTGRGVITKSLLEKLIAGKIDFKMLLVDRDPYSLHSAWELIEDMQERSQLTFLHRNITNINEPIEIDPEALEKEAFERFGPASKTPNQEIVEAYLKIAGYELEGVSPFDKETQIDDGSIDILVGHSPFEFLTGNYDETVRTAVDETTRLLRKGGCAVFTTGFNEPEEIQERGKPLALGIRQAELDIPLQANGLVLQEGPRKYTIEGRSPFHYAEVFAYKKE